MDRKSSSCCIAGKPSAWRRSFRMPKVPVSTQTENLSNLGSEVNVDAGFCVGSILRKRGTQECVPFVGKSITQRSGVGPNREVADRLDNYIQRKMVTLSVTPKEAPDLEVSDLVAQPLENWRRGWGSNPRSRCQDSSFRDCPIRPLSHLSVGRKTFA